MDARRLALVLLRLARRNVRDLRRRRSARQGPALARLLLSTTLSDHGPPDIPAPAAREPVRGLQAPLCSHLHALEGRGKLHAHKARARARPLGRHARHVARGRVVGRRGRIARWPMSRVHKGRGQDLLPPRPPREFNEQADETDMFSSCTPPLSSPSFLPSRLPSRRSFVLTRRCGAPIPLWLFPSSMPATLSSGEL